MSSMVSTSMATGKDGATLATTRLPERMASRTVGTSSRMRLAFCGQVT